MKIKTEKFEGPLDLLLDLIEEKKLSVNEVSLAQVADQYLDYIKSLPSLPMDVVSNFLVVASTLMLIKSRSLLPSLELTEEEEESIEDLQKRVELLREIRRLSENIQKGYKKSNQLFMRESFLGQELGFFPPKSLKTKDIYNALSGLIKDLPFEEFLPEKVVKRIINLEERIEELVGRIEKNIEMTFDELSSGKKDKLDIVVNFLAVLELVKRGMLEAQQSSDFDSIKILKHAK